MCFTIPGKVVFVTKDTSMATVDYGSEMREAKVIGQKIAVGDYVIVQAHFVVQNMPGPARGSKKNGGGLAKMSLRCSKMQQRKE